MRVLSPRTLALWLAGLAGWLAIGAALGGMGVSAGVLLALDLIVIGVILWRIARSTVAFEAHDFLHPERETPSALTPYGNAAVWLSGFGTVGLVAAILVQGQGAFALIAGVVGGLVISSRILAPALAEAEARSLPDWAIGRFGAGAGRIVKGVLALSGIAVVTVQMGFAALVAEAMFGMSPLALLPFVVALALLAMLAGGTGTMLPAQAVLFLILFVGVLVPAFWLGLSETGIVVPHLAPGALLHEIAVAEGRLGLADDPAPLASALLGLTALFGTLALPHALARWPLERGGAEARYFAQRSVLFTVLVIAAVPLFAIVVRADHLMEALAQGVPMPSAATPRDALASGIATLDPPAWLLAALGAGALAGIVAASTSAAFLVASAVSGDPARETAGNVLSRVRWASAGAVIAGALVALVLPFDPLAAFYALLAIAASALLAPLAFGLLWLGTTAWGALTGMVVGASWCAAAFATGWSATGGAAMIGLALSALAVALVSTVGSAPKPSAAVTKPRP